MIFSPDGQHLATSEGRTVRVWNAATGGESSRCPSHEGSVTKMAYSPDGSRLAAASRDGSVKVWDAVTGETCLTLRGHTSAVSGVTYSPDGRRLVTAAGGTNKGGERLYSEVKLWDALTGQEILPLHGCLPSASVWHSIAVAGAWRPVGTRRDHLGRGFPLDAELAERAAGGKPGQVSVHPIAGPGGGIGPDQRPMPSATPCGSEPSPWSSRSGETGCVRRLSKK